MINLWERISPLEFLHPEYGKLYRSEFGEWVQTNEVDGTRVLKSETLKDAFPEAETPYKKPKIKKTRVAREGKRTSKKDKVASKVEKPEKKTRKTRTKKSKVTKRSKKTSS